jgi:GNAT superfamily N-acetyltransferase
MSCPSIVRVAGPADRQEIWRLFLQSHRENGKFSLAPEKVDFFINRALFPEAIPEWDTGVRGAIGVIGDVGSLEAIVLLMLGSYWYTHDRFLEEYMIFVDPECRRSFHARALIQWMKNQSDRVGLPLFTGVVSTHRTEAKVALYERMLPRVGAFFLYGDKFSSLRSIQASSTAQVA